MLMHTVRRLLFFFSFCFFSVQLSLAQYRLELKGDAVSIKYKKEFADSVLLKKEIAKIINEVQKDGFIAASADSIAKDSNSYNVYLHKGNRYKWARITGGNIDERILNETGNSEKNGVAARSVHHVWHKCLSRFCIGTRTTVTPLPK